MDPLQSVFADIMGLRHWRERKRRKQNVCKVIMKSHNFSMTLAKWLRVEHLISASDFLCLCVFFFLLRLFASMHFCQSKFGRFLRLVSNVVWFKWSVFVGKRCFSHRNLIEIRQMCEWIRLLKVYYSAGHWGNVPSLSLDVPLFHSHYCQPFYKCKHSNSSLASFFFCPSSTDNKCKRYYCLAWALS